MCLSGQPRLLPSLSPFPPFILPETPEARDKRDVRGFSFLGEGVRLLPGSAGTIPDGGRHRHT